MTLISEPVQWALDRYDFEHFPRGETKVLLSRRQFWLTLFNGVEVLSDKHKGLPTFGLQQLGSLPDDQIGRMCPAVQQGVKISTVDGFVCATIPDGVGMLRLFPLDSPALPAFNLFNGMTSMVAISQNLAPLVGQTETFCFAYVRGLFLVLVMRGVCAPANF
ncbi:MAG: hypothetical protein IAE83_19125 [Anaerolinea sp.]|nr:hypothetical protein [Anaerolinea sp.]